MDRQLEMGLWERAEENGCAGKELQMLGERGILGRWKVGLLSSVKSPGSIVVATYDLCQRLRVEGVTVVSGFHSPMEQECMRILLRSPHPHVWCLARGMMQRLPDTLVDCQRAVDEGRLLLVSPFGASVKRITREQARVRNELVAELSDVVIIPYASPGSSVERLSRVLLEAGKPLFTVQDGANEALLEAGARPLEALVTRGTAGKEEEILLR